MTERSREQEIKDMEEITALEKKIKDGRQYLRLPSSAPEIIGLVEKLKTSPSKEGAIIAIAKELYESILEKYASSEDLDIRRVRDFCSRAISDNKRANNLRAKHSIRIVDAPAVTSELAAMPRKPASMLNDLKVKISGLINRERKGSDEERHPLSPGSP